MEGLAIFGSERGRAGTELKALGRGTSVVAEGRGGPGVGYEQLDSSEQSRHTFVKPECRWADTTEITFRNRLIVKERKGHGMDPQTGPCTHGIFR